MLLTTDEEYLYAQKRGYEPLIDERLPMSHELRISVQKRLFGKNNAEGNARFYKWVIEHKPHICEECGKPLYWPSALNVSHILTRGAHPEMAHDPRNTNMLCISCHNLWEHAPTRKGMKIKEKNDVTIKKLKKEYNFF